MTIALTTAQHRLLLQALQQEVNCATDMLEALKAEADALGDHNPDSLDKAVSGKVEKMKLLEQASQHRQALLQGFNLPKDIHFNEGDLYQSNDAMHALWQQLLHVAEQCQQLNRINGALVERSFQQSRHALEILQGLVPDNPPAGATPSRSDGYNQCGQTTYSKHSRTLAQV